MLTGGQTLGETSVVDSGFLIVTKIVGSGCCFFSNGVVFVMSFCYEDMRCGMEIWWMM